MADRFPDHPGTITFVDKFHGTSRDVPAADIPEPNRFAYLVDGVGTSDRAAATERVPIVLVERLSIDDDGNLVPPETASTVRIHEYGPDRRWLRSTTMRRRDAGESPRG